MIPMKVIHKAICIYYDVKDVDVFKKTRRNPYVKLRQNFQYLSKKFNGNKISLEKIGRYYKEFTGNSWDHSTVLHSIRAVDNFIITEIDYKEEIKELVLLCNSIELEKDIDLPEEKNKLFRMILNSDTKKVLKENLTTYLESA